MNITIGPITDPLRLKLAIGSSTTYLRQYFPLRARRRRAYRCHDVQMRWSIRWRSSTRTANTCCPQIVRFGTGFIGIQVLPAGTCGLMSTNGVGVTLNWPNITILAAHVLKSRSPPKAAMTIYRK